MGRGLDVNSKPVHDQQIALARPKGRTSAPTHKAVLLCKLSNMTTCARARASHFQTSVMFRLLRRQSQLCSPVAAATSAMFDQQGLIGDFMRHRDCYHTASSSLVSPWRHAAYLGSSHVLNRYPHDHSIPARSGIMRHYEGSQHIPTEGDSSVALGTVASALACNGRTFATAQAYNGVRLNEHTESWQDEQQEIIKRCPPRMSATY